MNINIQTASKNQKLQIIEKRIKFAENKMSDNLQVLIKQGVLKEIKLYLNLKKKFSTLNLICINNLCVKRLLGKTVKFFLQNSLKILTKTYLICDTKIKTKWWMFFSRKFSEIFGIIFRAYNKV